jgi:hypothetical protein
MGSCIVGCSSSSDKSTGPQNQGLGIALLKITAASNSPFSQIADHATVTVSAPDMLTMTTDLTVTDTTVEGTVSGIPAGRDRLFSIAVYDSVDTMQYRGSASSNVIADSTVTITITVTRISGTAVINGTINEGDSIPTTGLAAFYPFNGNANDESGNGHNGTLLNVELATDRFGTVDKAFESNGGRVTVADFPFDGSTGQMTVSAWIMPDSGWGSNTNSTEAVVTHDLGAFSFFIEQSGTSNGVFHYWVFETHQQNNPNATTTFLFEEDKWYHIVVVADVNQEIVMYINNQKFLTGKNCPAGIHSSTADLLLGGGRSGSYMNGKFDDIRIYNVALSDAHIGALYREGGWIGN